MAVEKFITLTAGVLTEVAGTITGGTAAQDGKIVSLDATGRIDSSILPVGIAADTHVATAFESLSAANPFVYIRADGQIANASASSGGTPAVGFVLAAFSASTSATVYFEGRVTGLSGLTPGARYYLSDVTAGGLTSTAVSGTGKLHQYIGRAITATSLAFEGADSILRG
jgi:hypothetical protein